MKIYSRSKIALGVAFLLLGLSLLILGLIKGFDAKQVILTILLPLIGAR